MSPAIVHYVARETEGGITCNEPRFTTCTIYLTDVTCKACLVIAALEKKPSRARHFYPGQPVFPDE